MKTKNRITVLYAVLILALCTGCLFLPSFSKKKTPSENQSNQSEVSEDENSDKPELIEYHEGGFSFKTIPGWDVVCAMGIIQIKAPDAHPEYGPAFLIMAGENDTEMTTEEAFEKFESTSTGATISKPKKIKVGGFQALQAEMTSSQGDEEIKAYVITSMLTDSRQFTMMASSPIDRWDEEVEPYFDDVVKSIKFIDIDESAGCPPGTSGMDEDPEVSLPEIPDEPEQMTGAGDGLLHQWATFARASSEYGSDDWSAMQATGEPNVFECEDSVFAWASVGANTKEWIELTYDVPVLPTEINIYMNYNPSQVVEVQIITTEGDAYTTTTTEPEIVPYCPDTYSISLELEKQLSVNKVKIFIDQSKLGIGWNEIDAVELVGVPEGGVAIPPKAPVQQGGNDTSGSSGSSAAPYAPDELDPGSYSYSVSGYENTVVMGAYVLYQSIDVEYVIGFVSGDERYVVNLMLPKGDLKKGKTTLKAYDQTITPKGPTTAIAINSFLYLAESGEMVIENDPKTGEITGTFNFIARSKDFPDRVVEVAGSMNAIKLK